MNEVKLTELKEKSIGGKLKVICNIIDSGLAYLSASQEMEKEPNRNLHWTVYQNSGDPSLEQKIHQNYHLKLQTRKNSPILLPEPEKLGTNLPKFWQKFKSAPAKMKTARMLWVQ